MEWGTWFLDKPDVFSFLTFRSADAYLFWHLIFNLVFSIFLGPWDTPNRRSYAFWANITAQRGRKIWSAEGQNGPKGAKGSGGERKSTQEWPYFHREKSWVTDFSGILFLEKPTYFWDELELKWESDVICRSAWIASADNDR